VLRQGESTVIIDYAHNPSALSALVEAVDKFPERLRTLVFSGFNRTDEELVSIGTILGNGFDRVILFPDHGNRDRRDGELNELVRRGLSTASRVREILDRPNELSAVEAALSSQQAGELVVIGTDAIEESLAFVQRFLATRIV
jgi:cyanophycin synthetase